MMVQLNEILATFQGQSLGMDRERAKVISGFWAISEVQHFL